MANSISQFNAYIFKITVDDPERELKLELRTTHPEQGTTGFNVYILSYTAYMEMTGNGKRPWQVGGNEAGRVDYLAPIVVAKVSQPIGDFYAVIFRESDQSAALTVDVINGKFHEIQ